jgi:hypothetical protein
MIEINLLPPRYRRMDSTPAKLGLAVIISIVLILVALTALGFYWMDYTRAVSELEAAAKQLESSKKAVAALEHVNKTWEMQQKRKETVVSLFKSRMLFAPRLARLQELTPQNIMISNLEFNTEVKKGDRKSAGGVVRTMKIAGTVRVPYAEAEAMLGLVGQDGRDDERMKVLSNYVDTLQGDLDGFYKDCSGTIKYISPIVKSFVDDAYYYDGEPTPYRFLQVPVYTFSIAASVETAVEENKKK